MQALALATIRFYQRHLSPRKGYCCAYRHHTGRASCSQLGYRAIRRLGLWRGLLALRIRLGRCGVAHRRYSRRGLALGGQAGFCDCACDLPCDLDASTACDIAGNLPCDCGLDWPTSEKRKESEQYVHIPPATGREDVSGRFADDRRVSSNS